MFIICYALTSIVGGYVRCAGENHQGLDAVRIWVHLGHGHRDSAIICGPGGATALECMLASGR